MDYKLMHKNIPVLQFTLDSVTGAVTAIGDIERKDHIPVGISSEKGKPDRAVLNKWWAGRAIPASRQGIRDALQGMGVCTPQNLLDKCMGLSLSDQYWVCPENVPVTWKDVNFFKHDFSEDVGNILFGKKISSPGISLLSPDNTSDGWLKKKWSLIDGKRCLIKGGSGIARQEPYNEVFASVLMERLKIPHVSYRLKVEEKIPYSVCENFVTPDTELVSAWYVMQTEKKQNHISVYRHFMDCCEKLGIHGVQESMDRMVVVDYLIVNEDRHLNNFGAIRNAETLEWGGMAPIYDSGTSLWFELPETMIHKNAPVTCKPFKNSHQEQLQLVSSFEWIDWPALSGIEDEFREIVKDSLFVSGNRCDVICTAIKGRIELLRAYVEQKEKRHFAIADCFNDVEKDVAYSGDK